MIEFSFLNYELGKNAHGSITYLAPFILFEWASLAPSGWISFLFMEASRRIRVGLVLQFQPQGLIAPICWFPLV
ncbi:hypothetical protein P175DRAFT_0253505 [Aspergillus ochraceoroseus IBT 24754]|uniref:Uncharacterized protein n=1 Tax=Aspergillus ochraceoroseus IBT 24754 TaxID=1392256 RepID=A0A2T5LYB4_9EURO|nr:uncharacterized protein P175DRAFT_0253505 [Aspergillus ochraceoroseus IBT 24754]PTU21276.1 hypothetical protein P175DRAFT_0253505 [Aspergillus ochraceoroseus IBT 24754]